NYERVDTWLGALVVVVGAAALICVPAFAFSHTGYLGHFTDAGGTAPGLDATLGTTAGAFFAVVLLNASLIGAAPLTLATSHALASLIIAVLVLRSLILMTTTVFPSVDVTRLALIGGGVIAVGLLGLAAATVLGRRAAAEVPTPEEEEVSREHWTMPPLALLG